MSEPGPERGGVTGAVAFWRAARGRFLLYSLISALVGLGVVSLITFSQESAPSLVDLAAGAVIGVCINSVCFSFDIVIAALPPPLRHRLGEILERRLQGALLRIPVYFVGGVIGFSLAVRINQVLFPGQRVDYEGGLPAWLVFMGILSIVVGILISAYETMRQRLRRSVELLKEQEFAHKELELARSIQRRLLPPQEVGGPGYRIAARNRAARYVAGDFYDLFRLGEDEIGLVVADVAGKGIGASLIMASVKAMLPLVAAERTVAATLDELNRRLAEDLSPREFVALAYARFSPSSRRLELGNAGLPDPYLVSRLRIEPLSTPGERLPLAARPHTRYSSLTFDLGEGERLVLFTDGLAEQRRASGDMLGYESLVELFPDEEEPGRWIDELFERVSRVGADQPEDDWTAVVLDVGGKSADEREGIRDVAGARA